MKSENNLRIFCSKITFEGVKNITENTVSKINKIEHIRKEDHEGWIGSKSFRVKEKDSKRNQVVYTANIYRSKSSFFINRPLKQKFILEVTLTIQLWALENKTPIKVSDQKLNKYLGKLKKRTTVKEDKKWGVGLVIESKNSKAKLETEAHERRKWKKCERIKEKRVKGNGRKWDLMKAEDKNQIVTTKETRNKSWSSSTQKIKVTDYWGKIKVRGKTEPIVIYEKPQNITVKDHKKIM